ncbi:hypothetical protein ABZP36_012983 [Zizania latifolia]
MSALAAAYDGVVVGVDVLSRPPRARAPAPWLREAVTAARRADGVASVGARGVPMGARRWEREVADGLPPAPLEESRRGVGGSGVPFRRSDSGKTSGPAVAQALSRSGFFTIENFCHKYRH